MKNAPTRTDENRKNLQKTTTLVDNIVKKDMGVILTKNIPKMLRLMKTHIGTLAASMSTAGPEKRPVFTKADEEKFIESTGIPFRDVTKAIQRCKLIKNNFITLNNEFYILTSVLTSYCYRNKVVYKDIELGKVLNLYIALRIYKTAFSSFFNRYPPNREVMDATLERLENNRFNIKKYKTIYNTIEYIANSHYDNFKDILENPIDDNITYYIINIFNRIKLMMKTISNLYYENHEKGIKQGTDMLESETDDGETYLNDVENISTLVTINARKIYTNFVSDSVCNPKILRTACNITKISQSKMVITVNSMISSRDQLIETLIIKILSYYYSNGGKQIKSSRFLNEMKDVYAVSNTANKLIMEIKEILSEILKKYSKTFLETNNISTLSNLKKTLFYYMIMYICHVV